MERWVEGRWSQGQGRVDFDTLGAHQAEKITYMHEVVDEAAFGLFALDILIGYMRVACYMFVCFFVFINIKTIYHFFQCQISIESWQFISKIFHSIHVTMSNTHPTTQPKTWITSSGLKAAYSIPLH